MDNPLVQPDPGLYFWTILTFLALLFTLRKFAGAPLLSALQKREETIRQSLQDADRVKTELERVQKEAQDLIARARVEGQEIINSSRANAERIKNDILREARDKAESIVESTRGQLERDQKKALIEIRAEVVNLSVLVASKLLRRTISAEDNKALIEESIRQIDSRN